jgi:hypothetical protein
MNATECCGGTGVVELDYTYQVECGCVPFKRCGCGRAFTLPRWNGLPHAGDMLSSDASGFYCAEMRHCPCGSTIAVEYKQRADGAWRLSSTDGAR